MATTIHVDYKCDRCGFIVSHELHYGETVRAVDNGNLSDFKKVYILGDALGFPAAWQTLSEKGDAYGKLLCPICAKKWNDLVKNFVL